MSLYVITKTPLFIGADVTKLSGHSLEAYLNKDLIAIHQDPLGSPVSMDVCCGYCVNMFRVWV